MIIVMEAIMKKFFLIMCLFLMLSPLFATQRYVVGEVFTAVW